MLKIFKWYLISESEKNDFDSESNQLTTAIKRISEMEHEVDYSRNEINRLVEINTKVEELIKIFKESNNEIKTSKKSSSTSTRGRQRSKN